MAVIPEFLLVHEIIVEAYRGTGSHGPIYDPPATVRCFAEDKRRIIRGPNGTELISETTAWCLPGTVAPAESRVQVFGRTTTVLQAMRRDGGGLPTPDHVEVLLQ